MWVDPLHYAWAALMVNQFEGRNLTVEGNIEVRIQDQPFTISTVLRNQLSCVPF